MKRELIIFGLILSGILSAQQDSTIIKSTEIELMKHFTALSEIKNDNQQNQLNDSIINHFKSILKSPLSFHYPFDSLKTIGKTFAKDDKLKIYSWNVPYEDGSHNISCIIQYFSSKDSLEYLILNDMSDEITNPEFVSLSPNNWYGAMYYDIVIEKVDKQTYYFLMGYNPGNLFSNKKVIDVFYFDEFGYPKFGKPFFEIKNQLKYRIVFEYNEKASMTLHYDEKLKMIVFHRLVPIDYKYKDNPVFYGPDSSFDGFVFKKDIWHFVEEVDARND